MRCDFLAGKKVLTCTVNGIIYVPSLFELEKYCRSGKSELCPFLPKGGDKDQRCGQAAKPGRRMVSP